MTSSKNTFLPFSFPDIGDEEISSVIETLRSGWITTGPKSKLFEQVFAEYLGGGVDSIAVNSATAGLHLALESLGIGLNDEVIVPSLTFTATAEVVRYLGADPVIVDIDPITLNINPDKIREAITPRTKVIIPVHYGGLACEMDAIFAIAREFDLKIVEDAAHALPTTWRKTLVGQLQSDITVFSFYANKTMTTGEGGMIVTKRPELADRMRIMRLHGIDRDAFDRFVSKAPSWYYEVVAPGYKYNLTDIAAAIGIEQLRKLPRFWSRRQTLSERYYHELASLPLILPAKAPKDDIHAWHLFVVRVSESSDKTRDEVIQGLSSMGIGSSVHYVPLHRQPYWSQRYDLTPEMFSVSESAYRSMLSIPLYSAMSDSDQTRVIESLFTLFK